MSLKKDSVNYMDAINVKIAEEYKPPRKINMIMTHAQRLSLNEQLQNNLQNYDFTLEKHLLAKTKEWKNHRIINNEQRRIRMEILREKEEAANENDDSSPEDVPKITTTENEIVLNTVSPNNIYSNGLLLPTKVSNVSQPTLSHEYNQTTKDMSPFNISEFEADTSSPFDNVALKSINDVEELAKVLKIDDLAPNSSASTSYSNYQINSTNHQAAPNNYTKFIPTSLYNVQSSHATINEFNNIQTSSSSFPMSSYPISNNFLSTYEKSKFPISKREDIIARNIPSSKKIDSSNLPNPYDDLPKHLQELSRGISLMGFPLPRVARTCKAIGDDNKKVLDHLLALSELLDLGFDEGKVSEALLMSDNDRDKALDKLIS